MSEVLTAREKIGRAKATLILEQPFLATIMCALEFIEDPTLWSKTLATNGKVIRYHPEWVLENERAVVMFGVCHEVMHCIWKHMHRRGHRHPMLWNMAGDYVINDQLQKDGFTLWDKCLQDPELVEQGNGTTEGVYALLMRQAEENGRLAGTGGLNFDGMGIPFDDLEDCPGTEAEKAQADAEMTVVIAQAAQTAKMMGRLSDGMARFIKIALSPKVSWEDVLRRFVEARAKRDYSFARPKRRFLSSGLYLPSLGGQAMGPLVVAVDTSGSITKEELGQFGAEIVSQHEIAQPTSLHVIYFDSQVCHVDEFGPDDQVTINAHGGGGTAFSPIFREIAKRDIEPACVVVLTDLCCSDFGKQPDYPVLWVSTMKGNAPWGEVVLMKGGM